MAKVVVTKTAAPGPYSNVGATLAATAADASLKNYFVSTGKELVIARNSGASERTVTIESVANAKHRTRNVTAFAIAAGATAIFGPFPVSGWRQTNGQIYLEATHAEVLFSVVVLP